MEGSHASMQKAPKLPREPGTDGRRGQGPIMRRDAQRRQHMMTRDEGRQLAVRHAVLRWRQGGPCQQAALVALRAQHDLLGGLQGIEVQLSQDSIRAPAMALPAPLP